MRVAVGSDHAGLDNKRHVLRYLQSAGIECVDFGTYNSESADYPDYAQKVALAVRNGGFDRGILLCGTGIGVCITANKFPGIRAAAAWSPDMARLGRLHNDANVLCLAGRYQTPEEVVELTRIFLSTPFEGGRHKRRVDKIIAIEQRE